MSQTVVVLGASPKPDRYSNKAVKLLKENGHDVIPVHPKARSIEDIPVVPDLASVSKQVDTISVYVNQELLNKSLDDILSLKPERVILNPGTESEEVEKVLTDNNINVLNACTLVLLKTGQF
jgi:predicted CoA-binding protein